MKKLLFVLLVFTSLNAFGQNEKADKAAILKVLMDQQTAWNNYDLEGFMQGYWKNDSLKFYGSNGITYGWDNTLSRYKKSYPDRSNTGELKFTVESLTPIESDSYYMMGRYYLTREIGDAKGIFIIIFKRIDGEWKIVADMSCG